MLSYGIYSLERYTSLERFDHILRNHMAIFR